MTFYEPQVDNQGTELLYCAVLTEDAVLVACFFFCDSVIVADKNMPLELYNYGTICTQVPFCATGPVCQQVYTVATQPVSTHTIEGVQIKGQVCLNRLAQAHLIHEQQPNQLWRAGGSDSRYADGGAGKRGGG